MDKHQKAQKDIIDASDKRWQQFRLYSDWLTSCSFCALSQIRFYDSLHLFV